MAKSILHTSQMWPRFPGKRVTSPILLQTSELGGELQPARSLPPTHAVPTAASQHGGLEILETGNYLLVYYHLFSPRRMTDLHFSLFLY